MGIIQALPESGAWAAAQGRFVNRTRRTPAIRRKEDFIVLLYTIWENNPAGILNKEGLWDMLKNTPNGVLLPAQRAGLPEVSPLFFAGRRSCWALTHGAFL
jgi:hypothetical protein